MARHYRTAALESCLGNSGVAIENLRAAIAAGWLDIRSLQLDPRFDAIRTDSRFAEIMESLRAKIAEHRRDAGLL
jgi:hypothetical protein